MGMTEYEEKLALAQKSAGFASYTELLAIVRKEKLRVSRVVVRFGRELLENFKWRLGSDVWMVYEQVFVAALDEHEDELADKCLAALKVQFPKSWRVGRLEGMQLEQKGEYAKAEQLYTEILTANSANALAMKRRIAVLKAQKKTQEFIAALNDYLKNYTVDQPAWTELGEAYLSIGAYKYGAFCFEELVLLNPMDSFLHSRLGDIYATLGGLDNLRLARKHYCRSIELNKNRNTRAYAGLVSCTRAITTHRNNQRGGDADDAVLNERVYKFALDYLTTFYAAKASPEIAEIAQAAFKSL